MFSKNRCRRCGVFGKQIIKIGAILAIFWPFEDFGRFLYKLVAESKGSLTSKRDSFRPPYIFYSFLKPLLGQLRKKIEVTSRNQIFSLLILHSYCEIIRLLTGARRGRKNSTKYFIHQSLRINIRIRLIKQWSITPILFSTTWHQLSSCFVPVAVHTVTIFVT